MTARRLIRCLGALISAGSCAAPRAMVLPGTRDKRKIHPKFDRLRRVLDDRFTDGFSQPRLTKLGLVEAQVAWCRCPLSGIRLTT